MDLQHECGATREADTGSGEANQHQEKERSTL
jgi:hypothetical protein